MSRAFVKEGDQEEIPMIPPRAPLPPEAINYVTPFGLQQLIEEKRALEQEKETIQLENDTEKRIALTVIAGKLQLLNERISSAKVLDKSSMPEDEVRFGATVKLKLLGKNIKQEFQIVGVDEADTKQKKVAFTAPIAVAVIGKKIGEIARLELGKEVRELQILDITYN